MNIKYSPSKVATLLILFNLTFAFSYVSSHSIPARPPQKVAGKCPKDTLKFGVCGSWLGLIHETIGSKPSKECCALIQGIADLEAAMCLCSVVKANVLGLVNVQVPIDVSLLISACGKKVPKGFQCS
ncbi:Bifunctional inhibitor/lipid-transfer protein/seed storage 2S albumin superfamily protein [Euphorbia peplus]|nr:Bifunctional inhibitor/lipid-transfer protein/seed storage 2S albumin superfamily protein [Euphorbia peplus]